MVQAFPLNRANQRFYECVLPRTLRCGHDFLDSQRLDAIAELLTVDRVPITEQTTLGIAFRKRFNHLLCCPLGRRMLVDAEVEDPSTFMLDHEEQKNT